MIAAANLDKSFGSPQGGDLQALSGIEFDIDIGEFVSIVGPSGCGKSTLLRIISGLTPPTSGTLSVGGESSGVELAYVLQDPTLLPWRRVEENVALPLELRGVEQHERTRRVRDALDMVGLADSAALAPRQLSGGMRMRVSIARALATDPELLLMDEPFGALDELSRQQLNEDLSSMWMRTKWTCLFVTHNIHEALFLSQRVLIMSRRPGRIIAEMEIPFAFPRRRTLKTEPDFAALAAIASAHLEDGAR